MKKIKNERIKNTINYSLFFIVCLIICSLLLVISYVLPDSFIRKNLKESTYSISLRSLYDHPFYKTSITGDQLDGFTDYIILNTSLSKNYKNHKNPIYKSFFATRYDENGDQRGGDQKGSFIDSANNIELDANTTYQRYWHGIQVLLRPLLMIFNYDQILYIIMLSLFILFFISLYLIYKNLGIFYSLAFGLSLILVQFYIISNSLQFSPIFALMIIGTIIINILHIKEREKYYPYVFILLGLLTSFFDLLTVPLVTLGVSLTLIIALNFKKEKIVIKNNFINIIKYSFLWALSYGFMFISKWTICSIISGKNEIKAALDEFIYRVNGDDFGRNVSWTNAIRLNFSHLFNKILLLIIAILLLIYLIRMIYLFRKKRLNKDDIYKTFLLIIICCYPYVWYAVLCNHSVIHYWMTYRLQVITLFSAFSLMIETSKIKELDIK